MLSALFWATTRRIFSFTFREGGSFELLLFFIGAGLVLFVFSLAWYGLCSFLIQKRRVLIFTFFISQSPYLLFLGDYFLGWAAYLILVFTLWLWAFRARKDFSTRSKVLPLRSMNFGLKTTLTLFLVVISFSFYLQTENRLTDAELIEDISDFSVEMIERTLSFQLGEFTPEMSFREVVLENAGQGILGNYLAGGVETRQAAQVMMETLRERYQDRFEISFESSDSIHSILAKVVEKRLKTYFNKYSQYIPYALVVVIFLGLKIFTLLYFWLVKLFSFIIFKLFLATGFVEIIETEGKIEKLRV